MLPRHIAIVMDGNGRWAAARHLPRVMGHKAGAANLHKIVRRAGEKGIEWLTLFAFSSENWQRPAEEVESLLSLLKLFIRRDLQDLHSENVRIRIIGERLHLSPDILALLEEAEKRTQANTGLNLVVAFNYGGRDEIVRAAQKLAEKAAGGMLHPEDISETMFAASLDTAGMPDPDLVIRTGGDIRISNFMLWQIAYAELSFFSCFWPDFSENDFDNAIAVYAKRERRFGRLPQEFNTAEERRSEYGNAYIPAKEKLTTERSCLSGISSEKVFHSQSKA